MKNQITIKETTKYYVETENNEWCETVEKFELIINGEILKSETQTEDDGCFYYDTKLEKTETKEYDYNSVEELDNAGWFFVSKHTIKDVEKMIKENNQSEKGTAVEKVRTEIENAGGIKSFSSAIKKNRPVGCPMKSMMIAELQELTKEELHVAFHLGLIGNANRTGSIISNAKHN